MNTAWKPIITFRVHGEPKGQPRPRAFARVIHGKPTARVYDAGTAEAWKGYIALAARPHVPPTPLDGPIRLDAHFIFARPRKHYRTGKRSHELRPDAPLLHTSKPDRDNLDKALCDCLTQIGMWKDDAQVCAGEILKTFGDQPGAVIRVSVMEA